MTERMTINEVREVLRIYLDAQIKMGETAPVPYLLGRYGVGKTYSAIEVSKLLNLRPIVFNLSGFDPALWAIPYIPSSSQQNENVEVYNLGYLVKVPHFVGDPNTCIILDEFDKVRHDSISVILNLIVGGDFYGVPVRCKIILAGNSDSVLYRHPALLSRVFVINFPIPSPSELINFIQNSFSQIVATVSPFKQKLFTAVLSYIKDSGDVYDENEASPVWTPRTIHRLCSLILSLPDSLDKIDKIIVNTLKPLCRDRLDIIVQYYNNLNYPDIHDSDSKTIITFLKQSPQSQHFAFVYLYTSHLLNCPHSHPIDAITFVLHLPTSLLDVFMSQLRQSSSANATKILSELTSNPKTQTIVANYTILTKS